jgi:hypothetical protein
MKRKLIIIMILLLIIFYNCKSEKKENNNEKVINEEISFSMYHDMFDNIQFGSSISDVKKIIGKDYKIDTSGNMSTADFDLDKDVKISLICENEKIIHKDISFPIYAYASDDNRELFKDDLDSVKEGMFFLEVKNNIGAGFIKTISEDKETQIMVFDYKRFDFDRSGKFARITVNNNKIILITNNLK